MKIVYYSLSGNTKRMAELVAQGINTEGINVQLVEADSITVEDIINEEIIILGCPASGTEVLEESYMEPLVEALGDKIKGKKAALFGSYGWGDGEWMKDWEERIKSYGAEVIGEGLIINEMPDEDG